MFNYSVKVQSNSKEEEQSSSKSTKRKYTTDLGIGSYLTINQMKTAVLSFPRTTFFLVTNVRSPLQKFLEALALASLGQGMSLSQLVSQ